MVVLVVWNLSSSPSLSFWTLWREEAMSVATVVHLVCCVVAVCVWIDSKSVPMWKEPYCCCSCSYGCCFWSEWWAAGCGGGRRPCAVTWSLVPPVAAEPWRWWWFHPLLLDWRRMVLLLLRWWSAVRVVRVNVVSSTRDSQYTRHIGHWWWPHTIRTNSWPEYTIVAVAWTTWTRLDRVPGFGAS